MRLPEPSRDGKQRGMTEERWQRRVNALVENKIEGGELPAAERHLERAGAEL